MNNMTCESEERMMPKGCIDSPSAEDDSIGGNVVGGNQLKKGPWTSAEDAILVDYVNKHGEGNWNAVQKHSGLSRCGKSCRLRWANHLRPDLRKGAFTPEEERHIIELHAKMGNKWARMAAELPGRTDNEIKNFWNTRIKRRQRAGLPIYPPDICLQALNENQQNQNMGTFSTENTAHPELLPTNTLEIPAVEFKNLELYPPTLFDIPASTLLTPGFDSSCSNSLLFSPMHTPKRLRLSESLLPGSSGGFSDVLAAYNQYQDDGLEKISHSFGFCSSDDHNLNAKLSSSSCLLPGSHALLNGNSSSSEPISWATKLELPSLQYSDTRVGSCGTPSPLPSLESVDTLIQSPPTEQTRSDCLSPWNSGLLEAVLYESRTLKNSKNKSYQQIFNVSDTPCDVVDSPSQNLHETKWEECDDPVSPIGHSAASVFSEYTPITGSSLDEPQSVEIMPVKQEAVDRVSMQYDRMDDISNQMIFSRPDFLLGSNCFAPKTEHGKDHSILTNAVGTLIGEYGSCDCKQMGAVAVSSGQEYGCGTCEWDKMATASQHSENH